MEVYKEFVTNYPMVSIEDPFDQDDFPTCAADIHRYPHRTHRTPARGAHTARPCALRTPSHGADATLYTRSLAHLSYTYPLQVHQDDHGAGRVLPDRGR